MSPTLLLMVTSTSEVYAAEAGGGSTSLEAPAWSAG